MGDYKLREYAQLKSLTYRTLWNKFKEGKLPNAYKDEFGHIYVKNNIEKKWQENNNIRKGFIK